MEPETFPLDSLTGCSRLPLFTKPKLEIRMLASALPNQNIRPKKPTTRLNLPNPKVNAMAGWLGKWRIKSLNSTSDMITTSPGWGRISRLNSTTTFPKCCFGFFRCSPFYWNYCTSVTITFTANTWCFQSIAITFFSSQVRCKW